MSVRLTERLSHTAVSAARHNESVAGNFDFSDEQLGALDTEAAEKRRQWRIGGLSTVPHGLQNSSRYFTEKSIDSAEREFYFYRRSTRTKLRCGR